MKYNKNDMVIVEPKADDTFSNEFVGTVIGYRNGNVQLTLYRG